MMMKQFISQYPIIGFGVPTIHRTLPKAAIEPPHFYYENVALAHKGIWTTILRFLYDVEPEFVNSKLVSSPSTSTTDHSSSTNKEIVAFMGRENKEELLTNLYW